MTAAEAIEAADCWLAQVAKPHGAVRSASFRWRFELEQWADRFCYHSYREWRRATRERPVEGRYILIEKWRVVFDPHCGVEDPESANRVIVDIDDRTGRVRLSDGW